MNFVITNGRLWVMKPKGFVTELIRLATKLKGFVTKLSRLAAKLKGFVIGLIRLATIITLKQIALSASFNFDKSA